MAKSFVFMLVIVVCLAFFFIGFFETDRRHSDEDYIEIENNVSERKGSESRKIREASRREQSTDRDDREPVSHLPNVGPNIQCTIGTPGAMQAEVCIASCITNMDIALVGAMDANGSTWGTRRVVFSVTLDGGQTWRDALITNGAPWDTTAGDPVATIDATGRMYAAYIARPSPSRGANLYVQTSTDSGVAWSDPIVVGNDREDKPFACVDVVNTSPYYGRYYLFWSRSGRIFESHSVDGGVTFSAPQPVSESSSGSAIGASPAVGPTGEVYVAWQLRNASSIFFDRSSDGGTTWGTDHRVFVGSFQGFYPVCGESFRVNSNPVLGCDVSHGPRRGWLYVCWAAAHESQYDYDLLFSSSQDNGTTWSTTSNVEDDLNHHRQMFPWMTVHPMTGDIAISWSDWREGNCAYRSFGTISSDGGSTWAPNFRVSIVSSNPVGLPFIGDYSGNTFTHDGRFLAVWTDMRNDDGDCYSAWFTRPDSMLYAPIVTLHRVGDLLRLSWNPVANAIAYRVYEQRGINGDVALLDEAAADEQFLTFEVSDSVAYYVVRAVLEESGVVGIRNDASLAE